MTEPVTLNVGLIIPNTGDLTGVWGVNALNPDFAALDGFIGGVQPISVSNANIVLTAPAGSITPSGGPTQAQNKALKIIGVLTGNVQITLPLPGDMIIHNLTTGAFVVTFAAASAGQVIGIERGSIQRIYNDGTNVYFVGLPSVGTYWDICDATIPAWITACTVPPYLNCNGSTFNATTYPYLNAKLGGNTLPDFRGVSPAYLNQGTGRLVSTINGNIVGAIGGVELITLAASQIPLLSVNVTVGGSISGTAAANEIANNPGTSTLSYTPAGGTFSPLPVSGTFTGSGTGATSNTGGAPHSNLQPTTIGGIRLIRAA
jgi:microcystin-dependent protein